MMKAAFGSNHSRWPDSKLNSIPRTSSASSEFAAGALIVGLGTVGHAFSPALPEGDDRLPLARRYGRLAAAVALDDVRLISVGGIYATTLDGCPICDTYRV
jgi:hypothetical protein